MSDSTHEIALLEGTSAGNSPSHAPPLSSTSSFASSSHHHQQQQPQQQNRQDAGTQKPKSQVREAMLDIGFGSAAGMIGKIIEYPFDTVKVRLQSSMRYAGPLDCFLQSIRSEGVAGLYRGISAPMFGAAVETSSLFLSYRVAQEVVERAFYGKGGHDRKNVEQEPLSLSVLTACGAASGAFTSMLLTPIELVKCQMQVPVDAYNAHAVAGPSGQAPAGISPRRHPLSVAMSIYRHNGVAGFWRGQLGTLIRETGGSAAWFGSYESVKALFKKGRLQQQQQQGVRVDAKSANEPLPIWQQMTAGACAGMAYNFAFYPADTIKSRMQTEAVGATGSPGAAAVSRLNFMQVAVALWKEQGLRGMYRGCGITVGRAAPSSAFIFSVYESLRTWFG